MKITVLGTGTSQGIPVIACSCPVCTSTDPRDNRLRCAVLLEQDDTRVVIDTGPDFRQQMLRQRVMSLDAVVLTHLHKDHIAGLDDVRAFNFRQNKSMPVYADAITLKQLHQEFPYVFDGSNYPGIPKIDLHEIADSQPLRIGSLQLQPIPVLHHKLPVNGFRVGGFAYVTDASYIPEHSMRMLQGLDVLVLNALRREKHIAHFNLSEALEVVSILKPKQAYFTHISHLMGTHAAVSQELPPHVAIAYDGQVFEL